MTQPNLLELAKQGDAQAIASVINYLLQPKDITAKVLLTDVSQWYAPAFSKWEFTVPSR
jgi:hypothetical protein